MSGSAASLAFDPLIPWIAIAIFGGIALVLLLLSLRARARGLWWRALVAASVLTALANPILVEEERRFLPDIAVVVVDQSESQTLAQRPQQLAAARTALQRQLAGIERLEVREVVLPPSTAGVERNGTRLIDTMNDALADVPRDRLAGVVLLTDGQVHDVPAGAAPTLGAPVHGVLTGKRGEIDRRLVLDQAPRFGVVGKKVTARLKVEDEAAPGTNVTVNVSVEGQAPFAVPGRVGETISVEVPVQHAGDNVVEATVGAGHAGADAREQPRAVHRFRRARPLARAAGVGRALSGRARLAQPAEIGPGGRSDTFHHPAHPGQGRFHPGARAVADRLPDERAVRGEAERVQPHHLRPLRSGQHHHRRLFPQHRQVRAGRRRAAAGRRARLCHAALAVPLAAGPGAAGLAHRPGQRRRLQAQAFRSRPAPSHHRRPARRRQRRERSQLGPLVPAGDVQCQRAARC